jgi:hypothetical protein
MSSSIHGTTTLNMMASGSIGIMKYFNIGGQFYFKHPHQQLILQAAARRQELPFGLLLAA